MYDAMPFILGLGMCILGMTMIASPKMCTKAEYRNDSKIVKSTKTRGIFLVVCGILVGLVGLAMLILL